jgi:amino acid permease
MRLRLTEKDIKELKYQCRMGYVLPAMIFILGTFIGGAIYELNFNKNSSGLNIEIDLLIALGFLIVSYAISHLMNKKYYSDIRNNEKLSEKKIIQRKIDKTDYEAGSGNMTTLPHNNPMKEFTRYDLIIDNIKYRIDKELFDNCNDGDEVLFYYAPKSKYLLSIEKKN